MSLCFNDVIKEGYVKEKTKNLGMLKKRWLSLCRPSSQGQGRLQVHTDQQSTQILKEYRLTDVRSVTRVAPNRAHYGFVIMMSDSTQMFVCDSGHEAEDWEKKLREAVRNGDDIHYLQDSIEELDNVFHVFLLSSSRLEHAGECLLHVSSDRLSLLDSYNPQHRLVTWPLVALRRYGSEADTFTFESGRSCDTGEGLFCLNTIHADAVHQAVKSAAVSFAAAFRITKMTEEQNKLALRKTRSLPEVTASVIHPTVCSTASSPVGRLGKVPEQPELTDLGRQVPEVAPRSEVMPQNEYEAYLKPEFRRFLARRKEDAG